MSDGVRVVKVGQTGGGATTSPVGTSGGAAHPVEVVARPPIAGIGEAPAQVPLVLVKGTDGILRPRLAELAAGANHQHWGDPVRYRPGPPGPDPEAPEGAVHFDITTGRGWRHVNTTEGN